MSNTKKMLMVLLVFILLMPLGTTLSYAWDHGNQGHSGGGYHGYAGRGYHGYAGRGYYGYGGRGYGNFGFVYNYSPYYYPYYPDSGALVSTPVVETPEVIVQPSTTVITTASSYPTTEITPAQITSTDTDNEITVNIPNSSGGYASVLIKRSGKGFIGPQGEFYPEFPKVSTLRVMYVK